MSDADWHATGDFLALQLVGDAVPPEGFEEIGATLLVLINGGAGTVRFPLGGEALAAGPWQVVLDTDEAEDGGAAGGEGEDGGNVVGDTLVSAPRSVLVARCYT